MRQRFGFGKPRVLQGLRGLLAARLPRRNIRPSRAPEAALTAIRADPTSIRAPGRRSDLRPNKGPEIKIDHLCHELLDERFAPRHRTAWKVSAVALFWILIQTTTLWGSPFEASSSRPAPHPREARYGVTTEPLSLIKTTGRYYRARKITKGPQSADSLPAYSVIRFPPQSGQARNRLLCGDWLKNSGALIPEREAMSTAICLQKSQIHFPSSPLFQNFKTPGAGSRRRRFAKLMLESRFRLGDGRRYALGTIFEVTKRRICPPGVICNPLRADYIIVVVKSGREQKVPYARAVDSLKLRKRIWAQNFEEWDVSWREDFDLPDFSFPPQAPNVILPRYFTGNDVRTIAATAALVHLATYPLQALLLMLLLFIQVTVSALAFPPPNRYYLIAFSIAISALSICAVDRDLSAQLHRRVTTAQTRAFLQHFSNLKAQYLERLEIMNAVISALPVNEDGQFLPLPENTETFLHEIELFDVPSRPPPIAQPSFLALPFIVTLIAFSICLSPFTAAGIRDFLQGRHSNKVE